MGQAENESGLPPKAQNVQQAAPSGHLFVLALLVASRSVPAAYLFLVQASISALFSAGFPSALHKAGT